MRVFPHLLQQLIATRRVQDLFLNRLSHELRTPLAAIVGFTGTLVETESMSAQETAASMEALDTAARVALELVDEVLDWSMLRNGVTTAAKEPFESAQLRDSTLAVVQSLAAKKRMALRFEVDASVPAVLVGDMPRLRQLLLALIGNAIKYSVRLCEGGERNC